MKIIFVDYNSTFEPYIACLAKRHEVHVVIDRQHEVPRIAGDMHIHKTQFHAFGLVTLLRWLKSELSNPLWAVGLRRILFDVEPDVVVSLEVHRLHTVQCLAYCTKHPHCRFCVFSETRQWSPFWLARYVQRIFFGYLASKAGLVDQVFVFTNEGKTFFASNLPSLPVRLFPAPIDSSLFFPSPQKTYLPEGKLRILMNARFVALKRHQTLFDAMHILQTRGIRFSVSLIGKGGHLQADLLKYARRIGVSDHVRVLEPVAFSELRNVYYGHDVLVLPSNKEAIGMVVPEAMACGLATVTSKAVGANTYVEAGRTGFIFSTNDVAALADALQKLSAAGVAKEMGAAAAEHIGKRYTLDVLEEEFANWFDSLALSDKKQQVAAGQ